VVLSTLIIVGEHTQRGDIMNEFDGQVSRRNVIKMLGMGTGIAAVSFTSLFAGAERALAAPVKPFSHDKQDTVATIANLGATAETLAATSYYGTLTAAGFSISNQHREWLKLALSSELYHLAILESLGGKALASEFYIPAAFLSDLGTNTATFMAAETAFTGAYLAATRRFAELNQPRLAATTAQHAATEAEHLALTRIIGGFVPNPNGLPAPIYYNVSDAVPTLTPFLTGGEGFIGPVKFPGVAAIKAFLGNTEAIAVAPFVGVF
jgi:hypothetical protein